MAGTIISDGNLAVTKDLDAYIPIGGASFPVTTTRQISEWERVEYTDDHTLVATDAFKEILMDKGSAVNLTVPPFTSIPFPPGTRIRVRRVGAGGLTFVEGSGVTITPSFGALTDPAINTEMELVHTDTQDTWFLDNGIPNTAVPTSRTLAGLDLSTNRTATEILTALGNPPYISGRLYGTATNYTAATTAALTGGSIRATPVWVRRSVTIDALVTEVSTVGSFNFYMAIYTDTGSFYPGTRVAQTAELDGSTPAAPSLRPGAVSATLTPGLYWLAIITEGSISFRADANGAWASLFGLPNTDGASATIRQPFYSLAQAYGEMPSTFAGGAAINTASGTPAPIVWFKVA